MNFQLHTGGSLRRPRRRLKTGSPFFAVIAATALAIRLSAAVQLASPFTNHMVLQRDQPVPVWGTAGPGEQISVEFAGQRKIVVAGTDGRWRATLDPLPASAEPRDLIVTGNQKSEIENQRLQDVLVGEVWLASGQSNMDFSVSVKVKYFAGVTNEAEEIAAANYPLLRMFTGTAAKTYVPQNRIGGEWRVCTPETAPAFSAVGYFFARDLQRELKIPVGIITVAFGASTAEAWIRREPLVADPRLKPLVDSFDAKVKAYHPPTPEQEKAWQETVAKAKAEGRRSPRRGGGDPVQDQHNATVLFNGMVAPIIPYAIRGAIWYQGESIVGGEEGLKLYPHVQATLVRDWRQLWGEGDFPFYIVQLAGQEAASNRPEVREAQATILDLPNTGMAVTTDIGEAHNVHPKNKQDVGDRLARIALAKTYGRAIEYSGPQYQSFKVEGSTIRVAFSHLGGGLVAKGGGPLKWFEVAGLDGKFVPAEAKIDGDTVIVCSAQVPTPTAARYAWVSFPDGCNLFNAAGLPAPQFRTDAPKLGL